MLNNLLQVALRLYPREHRQKFGAEMMDVFDQARCEARARGNVDYLRFCTREIIGLAADVVRSRWRAVGRPEPWFRSLEAPAIVVGLYALGVTAAHDFGVWGFFFPATYAVTAVVIAATAWIAGRTYTLRRPRRTYGAVATGLVLSVFLVPASLRALEDARTAALLHHDATTSFALPGIQVTTMRGVVEPPHVPGLTFSRTVSDEQGAVTLVHHRDRTSPPYVALGALLAGSIALISRRTAS
jgi:hypothetical protein